MIMHQWRNRLIGLAAILALATGIAALCNRAPAWSAPDPNTVNYGLELTNGSYYTIVDEHNRPLDYTAHYLYPGDELITADNMCYRITGVEGYTAHARLVGKEAEAALPLPGFNVRGAASGSGKMAAQQPLVGIYHTHSDESYVPSDGASSIYAHGGVFDVGDAFADRLKQDGLQVLHSLRPHDPHDANAYVRSRRTAMDLLKKMPAALFDVHRDAAPASVYYTISNGQPATRVRFVLGRGDPHLSSNLQFAKEIKAALDKKHPGIIQGILLTQGNFNQDLSPHALLIEVGAQTNTKEQAEQGVKLFADGVASVLGAAGGAPGAGLPTAEANRAHWTSLIWMLAVVAAALAAYLYINAGSWRGAWDNIRRFFGSEFGNRLKGRG